MVGKIVTLVTKRPSAINPRDHSPHFLITGTKRLWDTPENIFYSRPRLNVLGLHFLLKEAVYLRLNLCAFHRVTIPSLLITYQPRPRS